MTAASARASQAAGDAAEAPARLALYLPDIHCAACISTAERALAVAPGVRAARVNLTQKRATVDAASWVEPRDLIASLNDAGISALEFDAAAVPQTDPAERAMLLRLGIAGFAMMNVMLLSVAVWAGAADATRDLFHWLAALIAVPAALIAAQPFFRSALRMLSARRLNMDVPISLAILLALGLSLYETARSGQHAYYDAALALTFFLLVGRYLDLRVRGRARSAARELAALEVPRAIRIDGDRRTEVRAASLTPGDLILVPPGSRLPADGTVTDGRSEVDRSFLTGETAPVHVAPRAELAAGEINLSGPLTLRVTAAGRDTRLARIADLVAAAENARSRYVALADRAARIYAPAVHLLALAAFAGWAWATGDIRHAVGVAVATLIITCPCALGLAIPAVSAAASGRLFRQGVLIKSGTALERLAEVDTAFFDKTGTLTEGHLRLHEDVADPDLALAAGLAAGSAHPLAKAIAAAAEARGLAPAGVTDVRELPGDGIEGWLAAELAGAMTKGRPHRAEGSTIADPSRTDHAPAEDRVARAARQRHEAAEDHAAAVLRPAHRGLPDRSYRPSAAMSAESGIRTLSSKAFPGPATAPGLDAEAAVTERKGAGGGGGAGGDSLRALPSAAPDTAPPRACCADGIARDVAVGAEPQRHPPPGAPPTPPDGALDPEDREGVRPEDGRPSPCCSTDYADSRAAGYPQTRGREPAPHETSSRPPASHDAQPSDGTSATDPTGREPTAGRTPEGPPGPGDRHGRLRVRLGRPGWIGVAAPDRTATCLDRGGGPPVILTLEDVPRPGAADAVAGFARLGLRAALVSGDAPAAARALAAQVGIAEAHAPERPEEKAARIRALSASGARVLMVGDGLNDTAALAEAHASIAPASALDAARVAADVVLTGRSLAPLPAIVATARAARARMRENLGIAAAYNAVAIPVALSGHATPIMAALAMSASSICVSLNAMRLR